MEPGGFEFGSHISKRLARTVTERNGVSANHPVDVERPETNRFHMKRANRLAQRVTLRQERRARRILLLCLYLSDQHLQTIVGSLSVIGSGHKKQAQVNPEMVV
jgi:hypothetical protein